MTGPPPHQRTIPVSVVVMTKDEERNIGQCLAALQTFSQVFVVDSGSTDRTREIAGGHGATVVAFEWDGTYPKKKQWCLENLAFAHDWVLYVDADEEVPPGLAHEIDLVVRSADGTAGYFVGYNYVFLSRTLRYGKRVYKLVLLDRRRARFLDYDDLDATNMWEVEGHYQPEVKGPTKVLRQRMIHRDHDSLFHYFERHNRYSDWEAVTRSRGAAHTGEAQPRGRRALKKLFDALPLKGTIVFFYYYVLRLGFLDGRPGFHFATAQSFYYWQIGVKQSELRLGGARELE